MKMHTEIANRGNQHKMKCYLPVM